MPWCYYSSWPFNGGDPDGDYNALSTFKYFSDRNFKIVYMSAINDNDDAPITTEKINAINEYITTSRAYKNNVIGYAAASWGSWDNSKDMHNQLSCFRIIERLYEMNRKSISNTYNSSLY
jgi:hypothetical protein